MLSAPLEPQHKVPRPQGGAYIFSKSVRQQEREPTLHDISMLPTIATLIHGTMENTQDQYHTLMEVREQPHVLDDETVL